MPGSLKPRIVGHTTLVDERRLLRKLDGLGDIRDPHKRHLTEVELSQQVEQARSRYEQRLLAHPKLEYPPTLPVSAAAPELMAAIAEHQVVVVAGETGSGKTTQLPKMCLELGRGRRGMIGHTQPRRIAARAVAERLAEETDSELGGPIGFQVRFTAQTAPDTLVKVMTDGILLAEIQRDRLLRAYDTIIIDEAHERSLTIDFLMGYLKSILPRRPDLKVIITSATIDPERFSRHFDDAPILEVSGRTYPVEIRYRPYGVEADEEDRDQPAAIRDAIDELAREGPGDILVFLSGEREIRDTADFLAGHRPPGPSPVEVVPLFSRLSTAEQHRVFAPHRGRRIVLATNVAETSLTVPGIAYVVDAGTARISRFSPRLKVQRLPIEPISQASARQRSGRCGRTSDGIAIRLYSEEDFADRPEYTDPEILRTNLASVLLQMAVLKLGDIADFPFIDRPDARHVRSGLQLLQELGAVQDGRVTPLGKQLARLPTDPRIGRMILAGAEQGCLAEVLIIAAGLSVQDPRERPVDKAAAADAKHARFTDPASDFLTYLNLWRYLGQSRSTDSGSAFRRRLRAEFLSYQRVRQWQDLHAQLSQVARELKLPVNRSESTPEQIHRALLAGLLSHVGAHDQAERVYRGARGVSFALWPGSGLAKKRPPFVMVAELMETSRLWGHTAAAIDPDWVVEVAGDLADRQYSEQHWDEEAGAVKATERILLFGLPLAVREVVYSSIDPDLSRELFIREALVDGRWHGRHRFVSDNRSLVGQIQAEETKLRRRDLLADEADLEDFFAARIPADVVSVRHFDAWWRRARPEQPKLLNYTRDVLLRTPPEEASAPPRADRALYPLKWIIGDVELPIRYRFDPGSSEDGVTIDIPLAVLADPATDELAWGVPGSRPELVTELLRSLPKAIRRDLVPVPDTAAVVLTDLGEPGGRSVVEAVSAALQRRGHSVTPADFDLERVPGHLRPTFRVVDGRAEVGRSKDLAALRSRLAPQWRNHAAAAAPQWGRTGVTAWDFGDIPRSVTEGPITFHPALVDAGADCSLVPLPTAAEQSVAMPLGITRLLALTLPDPRKAVLAGLDQRQRLALAAAPYPDTAALVADARDAALDDLGEVVWTEAEFAALAERVRPQLVPATQAAVVATAAALALVPSVDEAIASLTHASLAEVREDLQTQRDRLLAPGFVRAAGAPQLPHLARYLRAMIRRVDHLGGNLDRDAERMAVLHALEDDYDALPAAVRATPAGRDIEWQLEELRVSLFAQQLGTARTVSAKRIRKAVQMLADTA